MIALRDMGMWIGLHPLGQEAVKPGAQVIVKAIGDTGFDPAFRRDQGIGAEPLDA